VIQHSSGKKKHVKKIYIEDEDIIQEEERVNSGTPLFSSHPRPFYFPPGLEISMGTVCVRSKFTLLVYFLQEIICQRQS
jgi:hypothetical protein